MNILEQELYDEVSFQLNELAWRRDYPIHPSVALFSFLEGFREHKVDVHSEFNAENFILPMIIDGRKIELSTKLSHEEILLGWKNHPRSSPKALYDSICIVYDNWGKQLEELDKNQKSKNIYAHRWFGIRESHTKAVRQEMENKLEDYFGKHQENILLPVSGKMSLTLSEPKIFYDVLEDFPIHVMRDSSIWQREMKKSCGPCAETLLDIKWMFNKDYFPSVLALTDYFMGNYLDSLSNEKKYPFGNKRRRLRELVRRGYYALVPGTEINWAVKT